MRACTRADGRSHHEMAFPSDTRCPFACVASPSGDILVERSLSTGNANDLAGRILKKLPLGDGAGQRTFTMGTDGFAFRLAWKANGYVFVVLERGLGDQGAWKLLGRIRQRWEAEIGGTLVEVAITPSVAQPFASTLSKLLAEPTAGGGGAASAADDELSAVNERLNAVRGVMHDSIDKVLERGEKIELLVDRADRLETTATNFAKSSTRLRQKHRWEQIKGSIYGGAAVCIVLYLVAAKYCGGASLPICRGIVSVLEDGFEAV